MCDFVCVRSSGRAKVSHLLACLYQHKVAEGNGRCLEEMLRKAHPTVKSLLTALREVTVGEEGLADTIARKYWNFQRGESAASEFL